MTRKRVLVADDDRTLVALIQEILVDMGLDVTTAGDGDEALAAAKGGAFDLILLDVMMPRRDGYQTAAELSGALRGTGTKIVLMTCRDTKREGPLAAMTGAAAMLQKPFSVETLKAEVLKLLGA